MDQAARRPFKRGEHDCLLFLADWVLNRTGIDPAEHLRGRYATLWGERRVIWAHGGTVGVVGACARLAGLERTSEPKENDIGLIFAQVEGSARPRLVGAVSGGRRWIALTERGLLGAVAQPAAAWRVP
jgi:hypothetical protein